MRKLKAYSLAEILVALAIVGVIAALTIPIMVKSSNKEQYATAIKKNYAYLTDAADQLLEEAGGNFTGYFTDNNDVKNKFKSKLQSTKDCPSGQGDGNCWHNGNTMWKNLANANGWSSTSAYAGLILRNGAFAMVNIDQLMCTDSGFKINNVDSQCGSILIDINGFKAPNTGGRDIFQFKIAHNGLYPSGSEGSDSFDSTNTTNPWNLTCRVGSADTNNGKGCAGKVILEGKMDY